jgi:hypothetical protein
MSTVGRFLFAIVFIWGCLVPNTVKADEWINPGEERFHFVGGVFLPAIDTSLRVDNTNIEIGNEINLQDDLGFDDTQTTGLCKRLVALLSTASYRGGLFPI